MYYILYCHSFSLGIINRQLLKDLFEKRAENIKGVFHVSRPAEETVRIILVDDVVTTGSTMMEARKVLDGAGYRTVAAISIAHGL